MNALIEKLLENKPVITDGAWGTQFQQLGLASGEYPDMWNLIHPERVLQVAESYVSAGSRIILTNTFGSNRITLKKAGLEDRAVEIVKAGVMLSKTAAQDKAHVFASMGPTGKMLVTDEITEEELASAYLEQAEACAEGGADGIVIETMSDLDEALIALKSAKRVGLPVIVSMAFDTGPNKDKTMMGVSAERAGIDLTQAGADAVGANCGQGPDGLLHVCGALRQSTTLPIWIKSNAGLPELIDGKPVYKMTPEAFADYLPKLTDAGASFIGGCCGTSPEFIRRLCERLEK